MARTTNRRRQSWFGELKTRLFGSTSKSKPPKRAAEGHESTPVTEGQLGLDMNQAAETEQPQPLKTNRLAPPKMGRPFWMAMSWLVPALAAIIAFSAPFFAAVAMSLSGCGSSRSTEGRVDQVIWSLAHGRSSSRIPLSVTCGPRSTRRRLSTSGEPRGSSVSTARHTSPCAPRWTRRDGGERAEFRGRRARGRATQRC